MERIKFENWVVGTFRELGEVALEHEPLAIAHTPVLAALKLAGTQHLYADTADVHELGHLLGRSEGEVRTEIDGNTINQPLVRKVLPDYVAGHWLKRFDAGPLARSEADFFPLLYAILCARIGNTIVHTFAGERPWQVSLQLHMALGRSISKAHRIGTLMHRAAPAAIVKVPFTPDAPECLLIARDLERDGVPVNLTSTFSARQAVAGALLAGVRRTNIFTSRLSEGLGTDLLGEHVALETQRALRRLRREDGLATLLIVASMREWQSFLRLAGCDVFTAPCAVIAELMAHDGVEPEEVENQIETSLEGDLQISPTVSEKLGPDAIAVLHRVEPEFVTFLRELRGRPDFARLRDGDALFRHFDDAGFGDLFHTPSAEERREMRGGKLPQLDGRLIGSIAIDTHFSLLANADFARHQEEIDRELSGTFRFPDTPPQP